MKLRNIYAVLLSSFIFPAIANATLITIGNSNFDDKGSSTIDLNTGLEWLDVTATTKRTYNDVYYDINHDGGTFSVANGWRYANYNEIRDLFASAIWQGYSGESLQTPNREWEIATFITLFGDTFVSGRTDESGVTLQPGPTSTGYTVGFFAPSLTEKNTLGLAVVTDGQFIINASGTPFYSDQPDSLLELYRYNYFENYLEYKSQYYGSWLVRSYLPEPAPLLLMMLGLSGLFLSRKRFQQSPE